MRVTLVRALDGLSRVQSQLRPRRMLWFGSVALLMYLKCLLKYSPDVAQVSSINSVGGLPNSQRAVPDLHVGVPRLVLPMSLGLKAYSNTITTFIIANHELDKAAVSESTVHIFPLVYIDKAG